MWQLRKMFINRDGVALFDSGRVKDVSSFYDELDDIRSSYDDYDDKELGTSNICLF